jgi:hypothetical protein
MTKTPDTRTADAKQAGLAAALKANIAKRKGQAKPVEVEEGKEG